MEPSSRAFFRGSTGEGGWSPALSFFPGIYGKGVAARAFEVSRCQESYPHEVSGKSTRIQVRACFIDFCALRSAGQSSAEHILGRGRVQRGLLGRRPRSSSQPAALSLRQPVAASGLELATACRSQRLRACDSLSRAAAATLDILISATRDHCRGGPGHLDRHSAD